MHKCGTCVYYKHPNVMGEKYGRCTKEVRYIKVIRATYYACSSYRVKEALNADRNHTTWASNYEEE